MTSGESDRGLAIVTGGASGIGLATCTALIHRGFTVAALALMFAKSLAVDYAGHGIRSNAVCPGMVHTPMGRVAQPEEIAEAVALLADGAMPDMTGAVLNLEAVAELASEQAGSQ